MHPHEQQLRNEPAELYAKLEYGDLRPLAARCDAISKRQPRLVPVLLHRRVQARFHCTEKHLRVLGTARRGFVSGALPNGLHGNEKEVSRPFSPLITPIHPTPIKSRAQQSKRRFVLADIRGLALQRDPRKAVENSGIKQAPARTNVRDLINRCQQLHRDH